jgi:hypothetical protein
VNPLALPEEPLESHSLDELTAYPAIRLFGDRAASLVPGFRLDGQSAVRVARICRLLDGLPLAIELAAARVPNMTLGEIEAGLDDRFALLVGGARTSPRRHQALEATMDWSYELLSPTEQEFFGRLGVFQYGFPHKAAQVVCGGEGVDDAEVRDILGRLVDKSLVNHEERGGTSWYELLDSLRRYAYERIAQGHARLMFRGFMVHLAHLTDPHLRGPTDRMWSVLLDGDRDGVRAALELAFTGFREDEGAFLAGAAAASLTRTGRIGFLGGVNPQPPDGYAPTGKGLSIRDVIARFRDGFVAGVGQIDPGVDIVELFLTEREDWVAAFHDRSHGREAAGTLFSSGCDIVAHAAGESGRRVFEAAQCRSEETGRHCWGVGADYDEYLTQPEPFRPHVLTSVVKQVPIDVFAEIKRAILRGEPDRAPELGLETQGIRLSTSGGHLDPLAPSLRELRQRIISGDLGLGERPLR